MLLGLNLNVCTYLQEVDGELLTFFNNLASAGLLNTTNIIIISDHGMTSSENVKKHKVADYVDISKLEKVVERGAYMVVKVKKGVNIAEVVAEFNKIEGATAYAKADVPDYMKFKNHDKLLDILVFADGVGNYIWGDLKDNDDEEVFIPPVTSEPSLKGIFGMFNTVEPKLFFILQGIMAGMTLVLMLQNTWKAGSPI